MNFLHPLLTLIKAVSSVPFPVLTNHVTELTHFIHTINRIQDFYSAYLIQITNMTGTYNCFYMDVTVTNNLPEHLMVEEIGCDMSSLKGSHLTPWPQLI